eukprot:9310941-Pyramimonas_sp.AAC.2
MALMFQSNIHPHRDAASVSSRSDDLHVPPHSTQRSALPRARQSARRRRHAVDPARPHIPTSRAA